MNRKQRRIAASAKYKNKEVKGGNIIYNVNSSLARTVNISKGIGLVKGNNSPRKIL